MPSGTVTRSLLDRLRGFVLKVCKTIAPMQDEAVLRYLRLTVAQVRNNGRQLDRVEATLARLEAKVDRLGAIASGEFAGELDIDLEIDGQVTKGALEVRLTDSQQGTIKILPKKKNGQPAPVQAGSVLYSGPSFVALTPSADGMSVKVVAMGLGGDDPGGPAEQFITFSADADLGEGVVTISGRRPIQVIPSMAVTLDSEESDIVEQDAPGPEPNPA